MFRITTLFSVLYEWVSVLIKAAAAAVFSLSAAVQRQRQTPPLVGCQHLVTNDAAALSSAN